MLSDDQLIDRVRGELDRELSTLEPPLDLLGPLRARTARQWLRGVPLVLGAAVAVAVGLVAVVLIPGRHAPPSPPASRGMPAVRLGAPLPAAPQPYAQVEKGAPAHVGPTPAEAAQMLRRIGRPVPSSARVVALQADPVGGPPWGVLAYRTTTGVECEHAGRVFEGRVGVIDARGVLHPWPADMSGCAIGMSATPVAAWGGDLRMGGEPTCVTREELRGSALSPARRARLRICAPDQLRGLVQGILPNRGFSPRGARPVRLTIRSPQGTLVERPPHGAFLYVQRNGFRCPIRFSMTVTYADGSTAPLGWLVACPPALQSRP